MSRTLPLEGVRVLDLSRLLPGPYATLMLADMGAEVIKIEDPNGGDYIRAMPPHVNGTGAYFGALNRNKKSITINLKSEKGVEQLKKLVLEADILIESFRPGVMDKLGVGYDALKSLNPKLVYCAITGYGYDSPLRERAGHDLNYLAIAGVLGVNGSDPQSPPVLSGAQIADIAGGSMMAVISVLAALRTAEHSGEGAFVDASMTDGAMATLGMVLPTERAMREAGISDGSPGPGTMQLNGKYACYAVYEAKDGPVTLGALEPKFWMNFCTAIGKSDWMHNGFNELHKDIEFAEALRAEFMSRTKQEWEQLNATFDFCCEPILNFEQVWEHPHVQHRKLLWNLDVGEGTIPQMSVPIAFKGATRSEHTAPPALGQHNEEFLE